MKKIKVGILCNIVVPYTIPTFNYLAKCPDFEVKVLYIAKEAENRVWDTAMYENKMKYVHLFLPGIKLRFSIKTEFAQYVFNYSLLSILRKEKFDVIITYGWFDFACQCVAVFHNFFGARHIVWSDSTIHEGSWIRSVTQYFVQWFVRQADACIASGIQAKGYFRALGVPADRICIAPNSIDISFFSKSVKAKRKSRSGIRKKFGMASNATVFLFVGQFVHRKGVDVLLQAVLQIQKTSNKKIHLLLAGYGVEMERYQAFIKKNKLADITIVHKASGNDLYECYAVADVFVLPSREETWGLVVNEALASELPVILSTKVGSGPDTVVHGQNGFIFQNENDRQLKKYMVQLCNPSVLKMMKNAVLEKSKHFSPSQTAAGFSSAISKSLEK
jgi:glycosyltransferase involved in cell wall biosynthesis